MPRILVRFSLAIALLVLCLLSVACGPDAAGGGASPEAASVVLMGLKADTETDSVTQVPVCMGTAISPTTIVTAAHCLPSLPDGSFLIVDSITWERTTQGYAVADLAFDAGELRFLVPRVPLLNWVAPGLPTDGPGVFVGVVGTHIQSLPTELTGTLLTGAVMHTYSGGGVFQAGHLVGALVTCRTDPFAEDPDACTGGGRFATGGW